MSAHLIRDDSCVIEFSWSRLQLGRKLGVLKGPPSYVDVVLNAVASEGSLLLCDFDCVVYQAGRDRLCGEVAIELLLVLPQQCRHVDDVLAARFQLRLGGVGTQSRVHRLPAIGLHHLATEIV